jgi:hypothetical protein
MPSMSDRPIPPDGSRAVRLQDHKEGQCRAILEYENNELGRAIYCGEAVFTNLQQGRTVATSWCPYHRSRYIQVPGQPRVRAVYRSYNGPAQFKKVIRAVKAVRHKPKVRAPPRTVACGVCGSPFLTIRSTQYLCSEDCRRTDKSAKQKAAKADRRAKASDPKQAASEIMKTGTAACRYCGQTFDTRAATGRPQKLCSDECRRLIKNARTSAADAERCKAKETVASTSDSLMRGSISPLTPAFLKAATVSTSDSS